MMVVPTLSELQTRCNSSMSFAGRDTRQQRFFYDMNPWHKPAMSLTFV
mgnify:CR=1 FL=1